MNQTHIHLLITHLPIFGSILGGVVLAFGLSSKSDDTKIAAYILFIISSVITHKSGSGIFISRYVYKFSIKIGYF
uniref:hypothetical protein n=1 Tax=Flavobacterium sp. TaxID=239 RepID=UPI0040490F08